MSSELSRRQLMGFGLAGLTTAALTGCSGGSNGSQGASSLRVSWYGGDPVHAAMANVLALFQTKNAGLKIGQEHAAFADYWNKLATETAARNAPDVMRMSMSYFAEYAQRGALLDLGDVIGKAIKTEGLDPSVAQSGKINNKFFGIGQSSISNAVFYDPELIASLGTTMPEPSWTWDSFADWAKAIGKGSNGKVYGTADMGGALQTFEPFARQNGSDLFATDGKSMAVGQDLIEHWFDYWAKMRQGKGAPPASTTAESTGFENDPLTKGITPVTFGYVQQITFLQPLNKHELSLMTLPTVPNGKPGLFVKALDFWSIASTSKDPAKAAELVNFILTDDQAIKTLGVVLGIPPQQRAGDLLKPDPKSAAGKAMNYVHTIGDKAGPAPAAWPKGYSQLLTLFTKTGQDIAFGRSDPAKGAADFYGQSKQILGGY